MPSTAGTGGACTTEMYIKLTGFRLLATHNVHKDRKDENAQVLSRMSDELQPSSIIRGPSL